MYRLKFLALGVIAACYVSPVLASDAEVTILSPNEGAKLRAQSTIEIKYKAVPGLKGDHIHIVVDDQDPVIIFELEGGYTLEPLAVGKHGICVRLVTKDHVETGYQDCVMVRVD